MVQLPCPQCGSTATLGTFCKHCLRKLYPLVTTIKDGRILLCDSCDRVKHHGKWVKITQQKAVEKALKDMLIFAQGAIIKAIIPVSPEFEKKPGIKKQASVHTTIQGRTTEATENYEEEYDIPLSYEVTKCPACKKQGTSYFEGILQVRNEHKKASDEIRTYLNAHKRKGIHCTKTASRKNGTDYFLSSHRAVGHLAQKLHKEFGGELKVNAQHFSEDKQSGKILYRTNALIELPEYAKGDVIKRDDTYYYVLGISHVVKAENLATGSNENFAYKHGEAVKLRQETTQVSRTHPLEVLHPQTFEAVTPERSKFAPAELELDAEVTVAVDSDTLFLIPSVTR